PHLHALARYAPHGAFQVDLAPLCLSQFARSDKYQRGELQCCLSYQLTVETINGTKQRTDLFWIDHGRMMFCLRRLQRAPQTSCWIVVCQPFKNGKSKYLPSFNLGAL